MDMSFGIQALGAKYILESRGKLENRVYQIPGTIDQRVALMKLDGMGIKIDRLDSSQIEYLHSWE